MLRLPTENTSDREEKIMAEWLKTSLIDIVELIGGGTPKTSKAEYWGGNINWLSVKDFNDENRYVYSTEKTITEEGLNNSSTKLLRKDDIIISARGTVGELAMIPFPMAFNQSCYGVRAKDGINSTFLYYLIKHSVRKLKAMTHGSVFDTITRDTFANIEVAIPDIETQQRVAKMLADIDDKVENNQRINNNLEQQAQALVKEYCASTDFEVPLGSIMNFVNGFAFQSKAYQKSGKYRIVTIKNVQDGRIDTQGAAYIDDVPAKMKNECYLQMGDILLSLTGNVGRVGIVFENNLLLNQRVAKLTSSKDILPLLYFFFRLSETKASLETIAKGTAQQNLSPIETLKLSLPYDEDKALILSQTLEPIFDSIVNNSVESSKLAQLRDSLLPKLMSGELDVSDIDI